MSAFDNLLLTGGLGRVGGLTIHTDASLEDSWEDWSGVRSLGRARRRRRQGHRQRIVTRWKPRETVYQLPGGIVVMHPTMKAELLRRLDELNAKAGPAGGWHGQGQPLPSPPLPLPGGEEKR